VSYSNWNAAIAQKNATAILVRSKRLGGKPKTRLGAKLRLMDASVDSDPGLWLKTLAKAILAEVRKRAKLLPQYGPYSVPNVKLYRWKNPNAEFGYYLEIPLQGDCEELLDPSSEAYQRARILPVAAQYVGTRYGASQWQTRWMPGYGAATNRFRYFHGLRKTAMETQLTGSETNAHYAPNNGSLSTEGVQDAHSDLSGKVGTYESPNGRTVKINRAGPVDTTSGWLGLNGLPHNKTGMDHGHAGQDLIYIRLYILIAHTSDNVYTRWEQRRRDIMGAV